MSVLKPVNKQPRLQGQPQQTALKRTESVDLSTHATSVESARRIATSPQQTLSPEGVTKKMETHPKGHKVKDLDEVWKTMDQQTYLRLTDTLLLGDVWVQPKSADEDGVTFIQVVFGPHIKCREKKTKMSPDDLLQMLYLNDGICADMEGRPRLGFEEWFNEKGSAMSKIYGVEEAANKMKLANFILNQDETFSFCPPNCHGCMSVFFRKICYHSYKDPSATTTEKMLNPTMVKRPTRGKFEFIIEARPQVLPAEWREAAPEEMSDETH